MRKRTGPQVNITQKSNACLLLQVRHVERRHHLSSPIGANLHAHPHFFPYASKMEPDSIINGNRTYIVLGASTQHKKKLKQTASKAKN